MQNFLTSFCRLRALLALAVIAAGSVSVRASDAPQFVNLSARGKVGAGEDTLVAGFVIVGSGPKRVLVRVAGPALATYGVGGAMAAPRLQLHAGPTVVAENQGWSNAANVAEMSAAFVAAGAFPFAPNSSDSAVIATLVPGAYTATVTGTANATGVALLEVYELPATSSVVLTPARASQIQAIVDAAISQYEIPGIMYAIKFVGEAPLVNARGVRDTATGEALGASDHFRIGSASKTFIGMAALRLIDQDRLEFETPISRFLPANVLSNYNRDQITVRMLLSHTSGINNYTNDIEDWFFPYILDRTRVWTDAELVELVNAKVNDPELGMISTPGAGWYYSNTNTVLLGMIVERVMGKPIAQVIEDEFLKPLNLTQTIYPRAGESKMPEPFARGYVNWANFTGEPSLPATDLDVSTYDATGVGAAGAMVSTVSDLARWMEAVASNDAVGGGDLRRGHIDWKYFTSFGGGEPGEAAGSYGMNMAHEPDPNNNADYWIVGHRGQLSGYDTAMMYLPEQQVAVVLACTRSLKFQGNWPTNALTAALNDVIAVLFPELIAANKLAPQANSLSREIRSEKATGLERVRVAVPMREY